MEGIVTSIKPMLYEGIVEIGVIINNPPGQQAAFCNLFNDALNVNERVITGWNDANGKINDAGNGNVETRSLAGTTQKDAGNIETRTLICT